MRTSPVRNEKGEHLTYPWPWHTDSVFKEKEERRGRRLQRTGSIINGKENTGVEGAKVEVGTTTLWDYVRLYSRYKQSLKKSIFFAPFYGFCSQRERGTPKPSAPAYGLCFNKEEQKKHRRRRPREAKHRERRHRYTSPVFNGKGEHCGGRTRHIFSVFDGKGKHQGLQPWRTELKLVYMAGTAGSTGLLSGRPRV
jgi:hypothetical protein